jgi:signal transduction histidine kinase
VSEGHHATVRHIRVRTWPVVAAALIGLLVLIAVSLMAARSKAEEAYTQLDQLNDRYRGVESRLRRLRSDLHLSGILIRDYLLDNKAPAAEYRSRLLELSTESRQMLDELAPLLRESDPVRYLLLRQELDDYWRSYEPLFDPTEGEEPYQFLRREVVPRRDGVMAISAEIEGINNANLDEESSAAEARQRELRQYLTRMLMISVTLGLAVVIAAALRIRVLERRSDEERAHIEQAEDELRRLSTDLVHTQEEERKSLSRELHDEVGQMLTALQMEMGRLERAHVVGSPAFGATIADSKGLIDRMMRFVRDLAMGLRPSMLDDLGLQPALAWQAREFARRYNVPVDLHVDGSLEHLSDAHRTCIYRIIQEALTNCAKHSNATAIDIAVRRNGEHVEVTVRDNGVGISGSSDHRGLGLTGIKERVKGMGGVVAIERAPSGGTVLQASLPDDASNEPGEGHIANLAGG